MDFFLLSLSLFFSLFAPSLALKYFKFLMNSLASQVLYEIRQKGSSKGNELQPLNKWREIEICRPFPPFLKMKNGCWRLLVVELLQYRLKKEESQEIFENILRIRSTSPFLLIITSQNQQTHFSKPNGRCARKPPFSEGKTTFTGSFFWIAAETMTHFFLRPSFCIKKQKALYNKPPKDIFHCF